MRRTLDAWGCGSIYSRNGVGGEVVDVGGGRERVVVLRGEVNGG